MGLVDPGAPGGGSGPGSDGNLVVFSAQGYPIWGTGSAVNRFPPVPPEGSYSLQATQGLPAESMLVRGSWALVTHNGNLIEYPKGFDGPVWWTNTASPGGYTIMQSDGNCFLYNLRHRALWGSATAGAPGSRLVLKPKGQLVVITPAGRIITVNNPWWLLQPPPWSR